MSRAALRSSWLDCGPGGCSLIGVALCCMQTRGKILAGFVGSSSSLRSVQHLVQSVPTNVSYIRKGAEFQASDAWSTASPFVTSFEWTGTIDLSNFLSTDVAIDFRNWIGGEEKIMAYCNNMAKEGGRLVAKILGTETMEVSDESEKTELVAGMVCLSRRQSLSNCKNRSMYACPSPGTTPDLAGLLRSSPDVCSKATTPLCLSFREFTSHPSISNHFN